VTSGTVKWFNGASGYGYIVPDGGGSDLFVHRASIGGDFGAPVTESEKVESETREGGMGREAINVVAFTQPGAPS
jgi:cold shock protein